MLQRFIQHANHFGAHRQPFFFLIDFEIQKPLIFPLSHSSDYPLYFELPTHQTPAPPTPRPIAPLEFSYIPPERNHYETQFEHVKQHLQHGNSYLLNLTAASEIITNHSLAQLYAITQAKYKLYYPENFICFSPETFIQIKHNQILTYPMKGTINADIPNAAQILLTSIKEQQEHYTIVDLMRNDLAMVAKNIRVTQYRYLETLHTAKGRILQSSSEITGDLDNNWQQHIGDLLIKLLPAGSISGAPKAKTVSIIQAAEGQTRGYYTGIFGIFTGDALDSAVAIRFIEQRGNALYYRSGGGITHQSEVNAEYQELIEKIYLPLK